MTEWQSKGGLHPVQAGRERLDDPSSEAFGGAIARLLATVHESAHLHIVAQVGDSSWGLLLGEGRSLERVTSELWMGYQGLKGAVG